ncbi:MAG: CoA transferase, partial [Chloroflexi bacterium]|nr:CoA transferase [Chloroflexota bacterium]
MTKQAFEGVKILDFSWIGVGPVTVKYFADHGATVVHVESTLRPDALRAGGPFRDNVVGLDRSGFFADFNSSKYGVSLNLSHPKAREIALRMVQWADVVAESFTPKAMKNWGLDYESLTKVKPDIIMYSTCLQGQTGPYNMYPGFGGQGAALSGYTAIVGWPDRPPAGPYGAYTDFINPRLGALAIASALAYRNRTGKGTHIDLAQAEGGIQFTAPNMLDWTVNQHVQERMGNRSTY